MKPFVRAAARLGATVQSDGVSFRVWAPKRKQVEVVIEQEGGVFRLRRQARGYFEGSVPGLSAGALYRYRLDAAQSYPDPCSRFQPEGPHGPSLVVNPSSYSWQDRAWGGLSVEGQVIYEIHIGAFTHEGTFDAAARELPELKRLGITLIEVMPIAEFNGSRNWGYDGVDLFAPSHHYGDADAFKRFVDAAHAAGLGVVLDVVYNHFGPEGNYLREFSDAYFGKHETDWGQAINFDGEGSSEVREFFLQNAAYWIREFRLDGLRLDATQDIHDEGPRHILAEIASCARAATKRKILLIGENEPQDVRLIRSQKEGGYGLDALWADDFHHTARVALTGLREAYVFDYRGRPQEFISAVKRGTLYQGQRYAWQKHQRGSPVTDEPATAFIFYLQNHDQVANQPRGERIQFLSDPGRFRALTALLLLGPQTPLIFMGQEFAASSPFLYFSDHNPDLQRLVYKGRKEFLRQFPSYATKRAQSQVADPGLPETFARSRLDFSERKKHATAYALHEDLLRIRREDPVIAAQDRRRLDGAVLDAHIFVLRYFGGEAGDRLLLVNLGPEIEVVPAPEPLLAKPAGSEWRLQWSSEDARYGGRGKAMPCVRDGWRAPAESATLLGSYAR